MEHGEAVYIEHDAWMIVGLGLKMKHDRASICGRLEELPSNEISYCATNSLLKGTLQKGYVPQCTHSYRLLGSLRGRIQDYKHRAHNSTQWLTIQYFIFVAVFARAAVAMTCSGKYKKVVNCFCLSVAECRWEGTIQGLIHFLSPLHFLQSPVYVAYMASESPVCLWGKGC